MGPSGPTMVDIYVQVARWGNACRRDILPIYLPIRLPRYVGLILNAC